MLNDRIKVSKSWILLIVFIVSVMGAGAYVFTTPPAGTLNQTGSFFGNVSNNANNYTADSINVMNWFGLVVGSYFDSYSCHADWCVYQPWYSPSSIYAKNMSNGKIEFTGTDFSLVMRQINSSINLPGIADSNVRSASIFVEAGKQAYSTDYGFNISNGISITSNGATIYPSALVTGDLINVSGSSDTGTPEISGLLLDGSSVGTAISIYISPRYRIHHNNIKYFNNGINVTGGSWDTEISNNLITQTGTGINLRLASGFGPNHAKIWGNDIASNTNYGINVASGYGHQIWGNYFELCGTDCVFMGGQGQNNVFDNFVSVSSFVAGVNTNGITLNEFPDSADNNVITVAVNNKGINFPYSPTQIRPNAVTNNKIWINGENVYAIYGTPSGSKGYLVWITGNTIAPYQNIHIANATSIFMPLENASIVSNTFYSVPEAINFSFSRNNTVTGNSIMYVNKTFVGNDSQTQIVRNVVLYTVNGTWYTS